MKTKIIPFDIKTAKKIQAGEIKGRIRTKEGDMDVRIISFDKVKPVNGDGTTEKQLVSLIYNPNAREDVLYVHNDKGEVQSSFSWDRGYDIVLEVPDNEPQRKLKQNFETVAESDAYAEGYENGFRAGRCIAFDYNKCVTLKTNKRQLKSFDKVLVRKPDLIDPHDIYSQNEWVPALFQGMSDSYFIAEHKEWEECIPYEGNEYLIGTTDNPKEIC